MVLGWNGMASSSMTVTGRGNLNDLRLQVVVVAMETGTTQETEEQRLERAKKPLSWNL